MADIVKTLRFPNSTGTDTVDYEINAVRLDGKQASAFLLASEKGADGGVAALDATGKIPSSQLPSYVDDVIEGYLYDSKFYKESAHTIVITGETGKIYIDLSSSKTYRWSGSTFAEISASLALGETSSTAYRGDRGKVAYNHSQKVSGNPHKVTKSDVGLGNVDNKSFADITAYTDTAYNKVVSRSEQLVVNGNGLLGNNTNFSAWTYDATVANGSPGSFYKTAKGFAGSDEFFPVNPSDTYRFSFDVKSLLGRGTMYSMMVFYDLDKYEIKANNHMYHPGSTTTLAQDLKAGDTVAYLTDVSGWSTTANYHYYLRVWNYTNSAGYTYPRETYTRNSITLTNSNKKLTNLNTTNKTVTLAAAYTGATIPAGTYVSQGGDGGNYKYNGLSSKVIPTDWLHVEATYAGTDYSGKNIGTKFPPGVAYARVGFLCNYNSISGEKQWVTNLSATAIKSHTHTVSHTPEGTVTVTPNNTTVNSITAVGSLPSLTYTPVTAKSVKSWSPGTLPSLTYSNVTAKSVKSWSAGSLPSLTYSEVKPSKITAWSAGTLPSLTYSEVTASKITAWSAGSGSASLTGNPSAAPNRVVTLTLSHTHTAPTLTYEVVKPDNITAWSAGTLPSLTYSEEAADNITAWSAGSLPSLTTEDKVASKITAWDDGTLPSLTTEDKTADDITAWSAGTLPTKGSNTTVVTSIKSATFTGTEADLTTSSAN